MLFVPLFALLGSVRAATYKLQDNYVGSNFLTGFTHQAIADPTHGRVTYVNQQTALAKNLTYANGNHFVMRADDTTTLTASGPGRNSVRIQSVKTYTTHVVVFDVRHMPQGCATWPAAWEVGANWPTNGEIDIIEGVNGISPNAGTLHTSPGCTMPSSRTQTGSIGSNDCNTADNGNEGCGVTVNKANNYGAAFNNNGGGFYAMERTSQFIKLWFWARNEGGIPSDLSNDSASSVDTDNWGTPWAYFPTSSSCNLASHMGPQNIVINLTLCGDWAGAVFGQDGCPGDCVSYVNNNPTSFQQAYWDFAAVRTYV
ncbi:family 16 hypothetical endo-1,3(4)-beta-glucanase from glycoside hydrolase [Sistotremastrum suecicum HHB10207 ss-3]|uniref:Family 16 hypothetical endo-1,3(4)-beta-glucanase from glycoside hydrolase n=1 Tax=Sistotremastrum suecicum HHB10207 ss-3 TaxID=1314776 RepID=A0A166D4B0_9AGAM|nr:family 16 hypothetical endo-1,3(4)-beta-glucanase from glycoside hydrolase [Sistotremastrum suecicum HHB10207 ss-3]